MLYLLDTNVIGDFARGHPNVNARIDLFKRADLASSSITWMEVEQGFIGSQKHRVLYGDITYRFLNEIHCLSLDAEAALITAKLTLELSQNHPETGSAVTIGLEDVMIAAIALANDLTVVTDNTKHFKYVQGLRLENWKTV
jgi:tRNA(fMet)-specific endonuclease VapC